MGYQRHRSLEVWRVVRRQHGVISRRQLLELGFSAQSIKHRIRKGRLHPVRQGVYALGRPELSIHGRWMAAVLCCGPTAALSHRTAAALWELGPSGAAVDVSVAIASPRRRPGIKVHRRSCLTEADVTERRAIPVTTPICTLIDIATRVGRDELEAAINEADRLDLVDPETLRTAVDRTRRPGSGILRRILDRRTFALTDSQLERCFLRLARQAGLSRPETGAYVNGFKVDFYWRDLGLVVETDGLRYHRTPARQARDRLRDQTHAAAGLTPLRFTRAQVHFEPEHVQRTLAAVKALVRTS